MSILRTRFIFSVFLLTLFSACTPEIREAWNNEWQTVKSFEYGETISTATGFRQAFPNNKEKMIRQDRRLCLHEDAHEREITANGINDKIGYRHCTLTPAGAVNPTRFTGK